MTWIDLNEIVSWECDQSKHNKKSKTAGLCIIKNKEGAFAKVYMHDNFTIRSLLDDTRYIHIKQKDTRYMHGKSSVAPMLDANKKKADQEKQEKQWDALDNTFLYSIKQTGDSTNPKEVLVKHKDFKMYDLGKQDVDVVVLNEVGYIDGMEGKNIQPVKYDGTVEEGGLPELFERHKYGLVRPDGKKFTIDWINPIYRKQSDGKSVVAEEEFETSNKTRFALMPDRVRSDAGDVMKKDAKFSKIPDYKR